MLLLRYKFNSRHHCALCLPNHALSFFFFLDLKHTWFEDSMHLSSLNDSALRLCHAVLLYVNYPFNLKGQ